MNTTIKIGLEYEGVLYKNNKIITFNSLSKEDQEFIIKKYDKPFDNYNCLAECRTSPFYEISSKEIAYQLFTEITNLNSLYNTVKCNIKWSEQSIPKNIHNEILKNNENKFKKSIYTIKNGIISLVDWEENTFFRGGGIHLNISGLSKEYLLGVILNIYTIYKNNRLINTAFKSKYRNEFLFRYKTKEIDGFDGIELMSIGFCIPDNIDNIGKYFNLTKHFFHLFDPICSYLNNIKI